ncbi:MAG: glutamate--tRNA ligase, partial [Acidimicrobiales bacterium]
MTGHAPRVRFAPSPTGYFHVGSARTALFNWLVARQSGGAFILRIEDTDAERNREEWVDGITSALQWLGMEPDEGPFRQSARVSRYAQAVDALWEGRFLYACDCTREEIDARNRAAGIQTPGYDGHCRSRRLPRRGAALRYRTPDEGMTKVEDVVRGPVEFPRASMDDFVAVKANGAPLFVLANVVDDIDMAISHVIRGEDLLPTTPRGILVWEALRTIGWTTDGLAGGKRGPVPPLPVFAHLPMLVNEQRKKLSKRRDPVAVESYREQGYLPDAMLNYLGLLGWGPPGGEEVFTVDQMVEWFRLGDVNHSPAFFDVTKLKHLNGEYIRAMTIGAFLEACRPWVTGDRAPWPAANFH